MSQYADVKPSHMHGQAAGSPTAVVGMLVTVAQLPAQTYRNRHYTRELVCFPLSEDGATEALQQDEQR
jgi:hypothetical protein